jgi:hypothetical protein
MLNLAHVIGTRIELVQYPIRVACEIHRQSYDFMSAEIASILHEIQFQAADSLTGHESGVNKLVRSECLEFTDRRRREKAGNLDWTGAHSLHTNKKR